MAKISRRIRLVELYLDYRHVNMEIAGGTIKVDSMSRRMEGKAMVISPDCRWSEYEKEDGRSIGGRSQVVCISEGI